MKTPVATPWMTTTEAAEYLRMPVETIRTLICRYPNDHRRTPPSHGTGRARRFNRNELDKWQEERK